MTKPRVLIATPIKGSPTLSFHRGVLDVVRTLEDAEYLVSESVSTYVQAGRNALVEEARSWGVDEILWVDADMEFGHEHVQRLRSHDADVVGAVYCKRVSGSPQWTFHATGEPQEGTLLPVNDVGFGLLRMKMGVFDGIYDYLKGRRIYGGGQAEYFAVGRAVGSGWQSPEEEAVGAVESILSQFADASIGSTRPGEVLARIAEEVAKDRGPVDVLGEDIFFCRLARAAGVKLYVDMACVVGHVGEIAFPAKRL